MGAILAPSVALSLRGVGQLGAFGGVVWLGIEGATRVQRGGRRGCLAWLPGVCSGHCLGGATGYIKAPPKNGPPFSAGAERASGLGVRDGGAVVESGGCRNSVNTRVSVKPA